MNKTGPIIIIEDIADDQDMLLEIFAERDYQNELIFLQTVFRHSVTS
jgi:hypothetical protein